MSIQEISVSNNQRKKLSNFCQDESIVQIDDNGDVIVNVAAYKALKKSSKSSPIEDIIDAQSLDFSSEFFLFS